MMCNLKDLLNHYIRIEDVVDCYMLLHRASKSGKTLECTCPFHRDRHRSLKIRKYDQEYDCQVCGENGNVIDFIQAMEGCGKYEALSFLAEKYDLPVEEVETILQEIAKQEKPRKAVSNKNIYSRMYRIREYNMVLEAMDTIVLYPDIPVEVTNLFELKQAPPLLPDSYSSLCNNKIMPVRNEKGELSAFITHKDCKEKSKTFICIPSESNKLLLYGIYQAKEAIYRHKFVYLADDCEDVIAMHAVGFCNTVAYVNEKLTDDHIRLLKKYTNQIILLHNSSIPAQVKGFKMSAVLAHHFDGVQELCYESNKDLLQLKERLGNPKFIYYIRHHTRIVRLKAYEVELNSIISEISDELELAQTIQEKALLRSELIVKRQKLAKVSSILNQYPPNLPYDKA